ncbi:hypothetical protein P8605_39115 [Streptomyces sp. T-3]|nr:hypothetical protein [Streptomyces sp. T-3]
MNVLLCAACGRRLTEPVRLLDEEPEFPGWDGLPGPDGQQRPPATVPRGAYFVDPGPFGAPFVPCEDDDAYDGVVPGGGWRADERGFLVSDGPRGTYVLNPLDVVELDFHPDLDRSMGCCGPDGDYGVNRVCSCRAEVAVLAADCTSRYELRLIPDAVRAEVAA